MSVDYTKPTNNDICVAFCYYNPSGNQVLIDNTKLFEDRLKLAHIPYFNIELLQANSKPILVNPTIVVEASSTLLYKESLWNILEKQIPKSFTKVCFMDTNLEYTRADWVDCISLMLNFYDIVQPYNQVNILDESGNTVNTVEAAIKSLKSEDIYGNAWAVKRALLHKIGGFLDKSVVNSSVFFNALRSMPLNVPLLENDFLTYSKNIQENKCKIKYLNTIVNSRFNGPTIDETAMNDAIKSMNVNWDTLFSLNSSGLWELNDTTLNSTFKNMFFSVEAVTTIPSVVPFADVPQEPVVQEPVVQEPVVQEPVVQEPVVQKLVVQEPVVPIPTSGAVPFMVKLPAGVKNNADRAAAAALIAKFKRR